MNMSNPIVTITMEDGRIMRGELTRASMTA